MKTEQSRNWKGLLNTRIIAVLSIIVLVVSYLSFSSEKKEFTDVPQSYRAYEEIQFLTSKGIIQGYPTGEFGVSDSITRLQALTMILREKDITDFSNVQNPGFKDVSTSHYGYGIIAKGVELGIIQGKTDSNGQKYFDPSGKLTRAQMASILMNAYDLQGSTRTEFTDVPKSHWAYNAVQTLLKNKITTGYGNGKFGTNDSITRTQFAVMMARMLDKTFADKTDKPVVTTPTESEKPATTGKTYPDGWTAPVLQSSWTNNPQKNYEILESELGFKDGGRMWGIKGQSRAIQVVADSPTSKSEVNILFSMWDDTVNGMMPEAYRVPVVAKELFTFYFEEDAMKVWNYFNKNDIPENFTANGRNVNAYADTMSGLLVLEIGHK